MFVTWITFGYKDWNNVHRELGRFEFTGRKREKRERILYCGAYTGFLRHKLSTET